VVHTHRVHRDLAWQSRSCTIFAGNSNWLSLATPIGPSAFRFSLPSSSSSRLPRVATIGTVAICVVVGCRTGQRGAPVWERVNTSAPLVPAAFGDDDASG
jgi:hypothetical protein